VRRSASFIVVDGAGRARFQRIILAAALVALGFDLRARLDTGIGPEATVDEPRPGP
jgi:hypothetical protein